MKKPTFCLEATARLLLPLKLTLESILIFVRVTGLKHEEIMFSFKETTRNKDWVSLRFITVQSDLQTLANDTISFLRL